MPSKSKKQNKEEVKIEESSEIITNSTETNTAEENSFTVESIKTNPNDSSNSNDSANIVLRSQPEKVVDYITPSDIEKYLLKTELPSDNIQDIREKVHRSLQNLKRAWVEFGASVIIVQRSKAFKKWGYETFALYCENELKLKKSTIYEIIDSTLFLIQKSPDIYNGIMSGESDITQLPSYHSIYLIAKKEKRITTKKALELYKSVMGGELSTMDLTDKLRKLCGKEKTSVDLVKRYQSWYKSLKNRKFSKEIMNKAEELNKLLEALNQKVTE